MTEPAFRVEINDSKVCRSCGSGAFWDVVGPDNVIVARSYGNKNDAEEMAEELSDAYEKGRHSGRKRVRAATAEILAALENMMLEMDHKETFKDPGNLAQYPAVIAAYKEGGEP
jgi:hypothetical protein